MAFNIYREVQDLLKGYKFERLMIELNQSRLFKFGTDVLDRKMKTFASRGGDVYAAKTMDIKVDLGLPIDRVTAFHTGKLYNTFATTPKKTFVEFSASEKGLDKFYDNIDESHDILGLNEKDTEKTAEVLYPDVNNVVDNQVLKILQDVY